MTTRVIDQNPAHHLSCDAEEMGAIAPVDVPLVNESEIDLVNQSRRLKRVPNPFVAKLACSNSPELRIHERKQLVEGVRVTAAPFRQQRSHVRQGRHPDVKSLSRRRLVSIETRPLYRN